MPWNWLVCKIHLDARDGIFHTDYDLGALLNGQGTKCGLPQQTLRKLAKDRLASWKLCWKGQRGRRKLKGRRNRFSSIPFQQGVKRHSRTHLRLPSVGLIRFRHRGRVPERRIKAARLVRKPAGWYVTLFIDAAPSRITPKGDDVVGIDLGYETLATLVPEAEPCKKIEHPEEYQRLEKRLGQAQRSGSRTRRGRSSSGSPTHASESSDQPHTGGAVPGDPLQPG